MDRDKHRIQYTLVTIAFAFLSSIGVALYWDDASSFNKGASIFVFLLFLMYWEIWKQFFKSSFSRRDIIVFALISLILSLSLVVGKVLDLHPHSAITDFTSKNYEGIIRVGRICMALILAFGIFPMLYLADQKLYSLDRKTANISARTKATCFIIVAISWILIYLAAFPGIYSCDAYSWYNEFDNAQIPVTSKWSPVCAGWFYLLVHTSYLLSGAYEPGLAMYSLMRVIFLLWVVWCVLSFAAQYGNEIFCILIAAFYAFIPVHAVIAVQTVQAAPFMGCFAMMFLHLTKMFIDPGTYWKNRRNLIRFILWGIAACIFRNNARYAIAVAMLLILVGFRGSHKKKIFAALTGILAASVIYSGPVLGMFGITKGTALREMLSLPLQQLCYVYDFDSDRLTENEKKEIVTYIPEEALNRYKTIDQSISDKAKRLADISLITEDPIRFVKLYIKVGLKDPVGFGKGAYLQNLGLLYLDKFYPDARTWHPYLDYGSYKFEDEKYINIGRYSLFPSYDRLLGFLFGESMTGYGGSSIQAFSKVPVLSAFCRASTYFWLLLFLCFFTIRHKLTECIPLLALALGFVITEFLSPVILCRYIEPIIFSFPIILLAIVLNVRICHMREEQKQ